MSLSKVSHTVGSDRANAEWNPAQPREEIVITMPDGSERQGKSWETSPMDIAKEVSKSLSERIVVAKVSYTISFDVLSYIIRR